MKALVIVDVQNDFMPGGPLGVPGGDEVAALANGLMGDYPIVVATQDWHPLDHGSFAANHPGVAEYELGELNGLPQVMWPRHCVQGTNGAELVEGLNCDRIQRVFPKGTRAEVDSYSGFFDNGGKHSTGLAEWLSANSVQELAVCGVATDYCVKFTVLDALASGFATSLHLSACRGVDLVQGDVDRAIEAMRDAGALLLD